MNDGFAVVLKFPNGHPERKTLIQRVAFSKTFQEAEQVAVGKLNTGKDVLIIQHDTLPNGDSRQVLKKVWNSDGNVIYPRQSI